MSFSYQLNGLDPMSSELSPKRLGVSQLTLLSLIPGKLCFTPASLTSLHSPLLSLSSSPSCRNPVSSHPYPKPGAPLLHQPSASLSHVLYDLPETMMNIHSILPWLFLLYQSGFPSASEGTSGESEYLHFAFSLISLSSVCAPSRVFITTYL